MRSRIPPTFHTRHPCSLRCAGSYTYGMDSHGRQDRPGWAAHTSSDNRSVKTFDTRSRSRKTSESGASLLSNSNLELVLDLIDDFYVGGLRPPPADVSDLLGYLGPISGESRSPLSRRPSLDSQRSPSSRRPSLEPVQELPVQEEHVHEEQVQEQQVQEQPLLAVSADAQPVDKQTSEVVNRALVVAQSDGRQLQELLTVLDVAPSAARKAQLATQSRLTQLEREVSETKQQLHALIVELRDIQKVRMTQPRVRPHHAMPPHAQPPGASRANHSSSDP